MECCVRPKRAKPRVCSHVTGALKEPLNSLLMSALSKVRAVEVGSVNKLKCDDCSSRDGWLHICVDCGFVACFRKSLHELSLQRHIRDHLSRTNHTLAVSVATGHVYCNACRDYVYSDELDHLSRLARVGAVSSTLKVDFLLYRCCLVRLLTWV